MFKNFLCFDSKQADWFTCRQSCSWNSCRDFTGWSGPSFILFLWWASGSMLRSNCIYSHFKGTRSCTFSPFPTVWSWVGKRFAHRSLSQLREGRPIRLYHKKCGVVSVRWFASHLMSSSYPIQVLLLFSTSETGGGIHFDLPLRPIDIGRVLSLE